MLGRSFVIFGAGVIVGVVGARFLISHPQGRRVSKAVLKRGFGLTEWAGRQLELLREDVSDLVAEARVEREEDLGITHEQPAQDAA